MDRGDIIYWWNERFNQNIVTDKTIDKRPPAFVYGMSINGLSILRSLGRKGILTYGVDSKPYMIAFSSRYCHNKIIISDIDSQPEKALNELKNIGKNLGVRPVLFFTRDCFLVFLSKFRNELEKYFIFSLPDPEIVDCIIDKRKLAGFAASHNIPHPNSFVVDSQEQLKNINQKLHFPVIIKPPKTYKARGQIWKGQKLLTVANLELLQKQLLEFKNIKEDMMIQEQVPGPDSDIFLFYTYYSQQSEPLAVFTKRKLRQYPIHYGYGCANQSIKQKDVADLGKTLFDAMKYRGIGGVEFKRNSLDGLFQLIEIHGRTPMTGEIAIASGVDIPWIAYKDLIGEKVEKVMEFKEGVKWFHFKHDFWAYRMYKAEGNLTFFKWIKSYRGKKVFGAFSFTDWNPIINSIKSYIPNKIKRLFKRSNRLSDS